MEVESMEAYHQSKHVLIVSDLEPGSVEWRSPSNIAIVKYWGKHGKQLPRNPSLSFTLEAAHTNTRVAYKTRESHSDSLDFTFTFEGKSMPEFRERIDNYLNSLLDIFPFVKQLHLDIVSENSFPHSTGIASSASAMSALALCLCSLEDLFFQTLPTDEEFRRKASYVARLGSGSASRSIFGKASFWGKSGHVPDSADTYAVSVADQLHPSFSNYHDDILIVHEDAKAVSSRAGHQLMDMHPFADARYASVSYRIGRLLSALQSGDLEEFVSITEAEAFMLHGLMMSSRPAYILMQPHTLSIIHAVQAYRRDSQVPVCVSLDAGPNVHLLYPRSFAAQVQSFTAQELKPFYKRIIMDTMGEGPVQL